jgi:cysteine desulfurase
MSGIALRHGPKAQTETYLDWNATAPLRPEAAMAMSEALAHCGNPSSVHRWGRAARQMVEHARAAVASLLSAAPEGVVFVSGGTEANHLALLGAGRERVLVSAVEHISVLHAVPHAERIPVDGDGIVVLDALHRLLADDPRPALISVMLANNETGVLQPVAEVAALARAAGALCHVDAVQAVGRISCNINALGADLMTLSGHKIGGPKGVGAVIKRDHGLYFTDPLIRGGGQERGARAGTENVAGIVGFGAAATVASVGLPEERASMAALRDRLEAGLRARMPAAVVFGAGAERLPNTTLFALPGIKAETAVIALDLEGVAVSSGAACSSGKVQPSHVLAAMGVAAPLAQGAIRVSLGPTTTESEVDRFLDAWIRLSKALLKGAGGIAA